MTVWTNFVKIYAKENRMSYGCAMSDKNIKSAYKKYKEKNERLDRSRVVYEPEIPYEAPYQPQWVSQDIKRELPRASVQDKRPPIPKRKTASKPRPKTAPKRPARPKQESKEAKKAPVKKAEKKASSFSYKLNLGDKEYLQALTKANLPIITPSNIDNFYKFDAKTGDNRLLDKKRRTALGERHSKDEKRSVKGWQIRRAFYNKFGRHLTLADNLADRKSGANLYN